jgi:hypothetical protein
LGRLPATDSQMPAVQHANPQVAAISNLLHISIDDTWLSTPLASLAHALAGMAAMLRADAPAQIKAPTAEPVVLNPSPIEMLADPFGNVKRFLLECVPRAIGELVAIGAVYARYQRRRNDGKATPLSARAFAEAFKAISERVALRTKLDRTKIYCLGVKSVA